MRAARPGTRPCHLDARPGDLGIQYAHRLGFRTVAISRGEDKRALELGAHAYVDAGRESAVETL